LQTIVWLREARAQVVPVFVGTGMNLSHLPQVLRLCCHLGLNQIIFNRFVPTGQGAIFREQIGVPDYEQLILTLEEADRIAAREDITITLGVPIEVPTQFRSRFQRVDWTSCPVSSGQRRWAIGADLQIRRCNSFATGIGSVLDEGLERLMAELREGSVEAPQPPEFRPCQLLEAPKLVQISF
jgi:MoaA/NifB/PqqE/SkfB family radical SAM enzyme